MTLCPFMSRPIVRPLEPEYRGYAVELYEADCMRETCEAWSKADSCCWLIFGNNVIDIQRNGHPVLQMVRGEVPE